MTENQAYSLLSALSTTGSIDAVVARVKERFPEHVAASRKFLELYDKYHDRKEFKHGNGYIDVKAFKRACAAFAKGENASAESAEGE